MNVNGVVFTGSNLASSPHTFTLRGNILFFPANSNGKGLTQFKIGRKRIGSNALDGFAHFVIGPGSCLYGYWDQTIDIGTNAAFINKAGGQLAMLSGTINNGGTIILEDNSNTAFFNPISINTVTGGSPQFYYHQKANMAVTSFWARLLTGLGGARPLSAMKISGNTTFMGGNAAIRQGRVIQ
jgi:hypothetical protein